MYLVMNTKIFTQFNIFDVLMVREENIIFRFIGYFPQT